MRHHYLSLVFVFLISSPTIVFSQNSAAATKPVIILKGFITDNTTKAGLSYVSIGILDKPIGTLSDTSGHFHFEITEENLSDTLQISLIGYSTQRIAVKDFQNSKEGIISLQINYTSLQEVVITNHTTETETIGRQKSGKFIQASLHNRKTSEETIGSELGIRVANKHANAFLKDLNLNISANNFKKIKIRVNVYSMKADKPDSLITNKQMIFTINEFQTGWIKFDLDPYDIAVPSDFLVSIQWLEGQQVKEERPITFIPVTTSFANKCYVRIASQDKWKKMGMNPSCYVTLSY